MALPPTLTNTLVFDLIVLFNISEEKQNMHKSGAIYRDDTKNNIFLRPECWRYSEGLSLDNFFCSWRTYTT